jgi:hypothetical protein
MYLYFFMYSKFRINSDMKNSQNLVQIFGHVVGLYCGIQPTLDNRHKGWHIPGSAPELQASIPGNPVHHGVNPRLLVRKATLPTEHHGFTVSIYTTPSSFGTTRINKNYLGALIFVTQKQTKTNSVALSPQANYTD